MESEQSNKPEVHINITKKHDLYKYGILIGGSYELSPSAKMDDMIQRISIKLMELPTDSKVTVASEKKDFFAINERSLSAEELNEIVSGINKAREDIKIVLGRIGTGYQ